MINYPKNITRNRWNSMSTNLREVMFSPAYGNTVFQIAEDHHLNDLKSKILARLVGYVFFGLIHTEELDKKIAKELDIKKEMAEDISEELDRKLFSNFRSEISEMYSPATDSESQIDISELIGESASSQIEGGGGEEEKNKPKEIEDSKPTTKEEPDKPRMETEVEDRKTKKDKKEKPAKPKHKPAQIQKEDEETDQSKSLEIGNVDKKQEGKKQSAEEDTENKAQVQKPERDKKPEKESSSKPFMIHEEGGSSNKSTGQAGGDTKPKRVEKRKRSFSFSSDGFFGKSENKDNEKEAPKANIETPGEKDSKGSGFFSFGKKSKDKDESEKVVHYSENRTDLSDKENKKGEGFINLSNLEPEEKGKGKSPNKPQPENQQKEPQNKQGANVKKKDFSQEKKKSKENKTDKKQEGNNKNNGPKLDGNTIDLKDN